MCCLNSNLMINIKQKEKVIFPQFHISLKKLLMNQEDKKNRKKEEVKVKATTIRKIEVEAKVKVKV